MRTSAAHDDLRVLHAGVHDEAADAEVTERALSTGLGVITVDAVDDNHAQLPPHATHIDAISSQLMY